MTTGLRIPQLPPDPGVNLTDLLPLSTGVTTYKLTLQQLSSFINANIPPLTGDVTSVNFVTTISPNAVTTTKILNSAVTYAKIQNEGAATLLGNPTGVSAPPSEITLGSTLSFVTNALQTIALSGDITSSSNSFLTTIANNAVTAIKIANGAVTYSKIQNESASTLLGNPTGLSDTPSEITLGSTLSFVASAIQTIAHSGDVTSLANSFVLTIAAAAVTYSKIQNVSSSRLLGNPTGVAASPSEINLGATLSFSGTSLQTNAHTGDVTTPANSFVTTISTDAVTTTKILNAAVTYAKIQNVGASRILGNPTGAPGAPSEISIGATLTFSVTSLQTIAHSGDVTSPANSFVLTIATDAVTTTKILNSAVTYAKIQNVSASRLLGNPTGSAGAVSEISLGAAFNFSGSILQTVAFSGDVTTAVNSFSTTIAPQAVTYPKIQNVSGNRLLGNPIGLSATVTEILLGSTLTFISGELRTNALTGDVTTAANSFSTAIANNAVTNAKIANAAVTYAKIQNETASTILGNPTGSAAAPSEISLNTSFGFIGTTLISDGFTNVATFAATGTFNVPANTRKILVELWGAGGGGGGSLLGASRGGGGGAGGHVKALVSVTPGGSVSVVLAVGGTGGSAAGGNGGTAGGSSVSGGGIGTPIVANGGGGGFGSTATVITTPAIGGAGAPSSGGDVNMTGEPGGVGLPTAASGQGGGAGGGNSVTASAGLNGGVGAGGSGGAGLGVTGGVGGSGFCLIYYN